MDEEWCYTFFVNDIDTEIRIVYDSRPYTLKPLSTVFVRWHTSDHRATMLPRFRLEGVKLDHNISVHDLYCNRGIIIHKQRAGYSFQTFQGKHTNKFPSIPLSFSELPRWVSESRWTTFVNKTDMMIKIKYDCDVYTLQPMSANNVRWFTFDIRETLLPKLVVKGVELDQNFPVHDLYCNREITVFRGVDNTYSFQTLSNEGFKESLKITVSSIKRFLLGMKKLLKKVSIWRNQWGHLFKKYSIGVNVIVGVLNALIMAKEEPPLRPLTTSSIKFTCSKFICCMLEGEALLLLCGKSGPGYKKAAFVLSSPPPPVPTFSKFALVLRELHLTLDLIHFIHQNHVQGIYNSFDDWEWCEESCRPSFLGGYFGAKSGDMEDESLKADDHRQIADRKALLKSLNEPKFILWKRFTRNVFDAELEAIWRKRLQSPSQAPGPNSEPCSILNCFWIDKLKYVCGEPLGGGSYKQVVKGKWLGEMVAVAIIPNYIPKEKLEAEAGLLARVQHPNVVQLIGYAYEEDALDNNDLDNDNLNNSGKRFLLTEVMQQDLESLINDKCRQQRGSQELGSGTSSIVRAPFDLPVAIDMVSQIVEAMIHLKNCGVIHRDLKPSNCLASPKYRKNSFPGISDIPIYYTIKVTDFDTAKIRGENSYFHSERKGTACYMAPELYGMPEEKWPYTWSADVWSFGMTCYKIFTGRAPFMTNKLKDVSTLIRNGERPLFPSQCPEYLKRLIGKCWARNPDDRPTFEDIRKDLWRLKVHARSSLTRLHTGNYHQILR